MLQHTWTYKPLVHDVLGMSLNRVTVEEAPPAAAAAVGLAPQTPVKKHFEVRRKKLLDLMYTDMLMSV